MVTYWTSCVHHATGAPVIEVKMWEFYTAEWKHVNCWNARNLLDVFDQYVSVGATRKSCRYSLTKKSDNPAHGAHKWKRQEWTRFTDSITVARQTSPVSTVSHLLNNAANDAVITWKSIFSRFAKTGFKGSLCDLLKIAVYSLTIATDSVNRDSLWPTIQSHDIR